MAMMQSETIQSDNTTVWVFQTKPTTYDIDSALRVLPEIDFVVSKEERVHTGNKVYLWKSGGEGGLIASATVMSEPTDRKPNHSNLMFFKSAKDAETVACRVSLRIDRVYDEPLSRVALMFDPVLKDSLMILETNDGNIQLSPNEHRAIASLLDGGKAAVAAAIIQEKKNEPAVNSIKSGDYVEPSLDEIIKRIKQSGIRLDERLIRRYHLALHSRGFVILAGLSGTGKTWLSKAYADAVSATYELVCVAPNWNSNEHLLGHTSPFKHNEYIDTSFSIFLRRASDAYINATEVGLRAKPFHVVLDEMNLARVEYYFALFLSKMEERARTGITKLRLGLDEIFLPPNLYFIGTVNVDETTHGFSDKVYDRAQLIELEATEDLIEQHIGDRPYREMLMAIWRIMHTVAPFSFRVLDDIGAYVEHAHRITSSWHDAFDEQVTQKILPKVKGNDAATEEALRQLAQYCESRLPFTHKKTIAMLEAKDKTGVFSFFT